MTLTPVGMRRDAQACAPIPIRSQQNANTALSSSVGDLPMDLVEIQTLKQGDAVPVIRTAATKTNRPPTVRATADDLARIDDATAALESGAWTAGPDRALDKLAAMAYSSRGYALDWEPYAKTRLLLDQIDAVLNTYPDPLTVRQIYYRLIATGHDEDGAKYVKGKPFEREVYRCLAQARRAGRIAFDAIRDDSGTESTPSRWDGPEDFWEAVRSAAAHYRLDRQRDQPQFIELWCEAAGMVPQLARVVHEFGVPVFSSGGFDSLTAKHDAAARACDRDVPTVLLHVGDYDPSGETMFTALVEDVQAFIRGDGGLQPFTPVRVALSREQIAAHEVEWDKAPDEDATHAAGWEGGTAQLEAIDPAVLNEIVRDAVSAHVDEDAFEAVKADEDEQRADIVDRIDAV